MWLAYALSAVLLTSVLAISFQVIAKKARDVRAFSFLFCFTIFLMTITLIGLTGIGRISLTPWLTGLLALSGLGYGLFQRYQLVVRKNISAPEIQILITPTGLVGYVLAITWLKEAVTPLRILGYGLVFVATLLVLKRKGSKFSFNRYVLLALFIGSCLSIGITLDRRIAPNFEHALTYTAILWFAQALVCFVPYVSYRSVKEELQRQSWRIPLLASINLLVVFCQISAIKLAPATQVAPIAASNVVLIAVLSVILLNERDRLLVKFAAVVLTTAGLIFISR